VCVCVCVCVCVYVCVCVCVLCVCKSGKKKMSAAGDISDAVYNGALHDALNFGLLRHNFTKHPSQTFGPLPCPPDHHVTQDCGSGKTLPHHTHARTHARTHACMHARTHTHTHTALLATTARHAVFFYSICCFFCVVVYCSMGIRLV